MEPSRLEAGKEGGDGLGQSVPRALCAPQSQNTIAACPHTPWVPPASVLQGCLGAQPTQPGPPSVPRFQSPLSNPHVPQGTSHGHLSLQPVWETCCPQHPAQT